MSEELYFNNELRECLDAAVYSDCGENDQWNYWYQRLHKAHDAAVDRVTEVQRAENAKLRDLVRDIWGWTLHGCGVCSEMAGCDTDLYSSDCLMREMLTDRVHELGVDA